MVDVNALFDVALGLYDFDLVLYVAEKSQKDPKEYLSFLNELKKHGETYRRYKIDLHLKRYSSALKNISLCGQDSLDECLLLIKSQRLYSEAVELYQPGTECHKEVCRIYGDYLLIKKYCEDAALIYEAGGLLLEAVQAWEKSPNWSYCLALAKTVVHPQNEFVALCRRIAEKLREEKRFSEAAQVLNEYLNDPEEAVVTLLEGRNWDEATRIIHEHQRPDLFDTHFNVSLKEASEDTLASIEKNKIAFHDQLLRLDKVVEMKQKLADGLLDEVDINLEDADLYSDTTSHAGSLGQSIGRPVKSHTASLQTRTSNRSKLSSRNRRKHEKKKYSTKEGSTYEDLGLIAAQYDLIKKVFKSCSEVGQLNRALCKSGSTGQARIIQRTLNGLIKDIKENETKIWSPSWFGSSTSADSDGNKFGPQATTADIVDRSNQGTVYQPELSLLGTLKLHN